jgi:hypothetical protein
MATGRSESRPGVFATPQRFGAARGQAYLRATLWGDQRTDQAFAQRLRNVKRPTGFSGQAFGCHQRAGQAFAQFFGAVKRPTGFSSTAFGMQEEPRGLCATHWGFVQRLEAVRGPSRPSRNALGRSEDPPDPRATLLGGQRTGQVFAQRSEAVKRTWSSKAFELQEEPRGLRATRWGGREAFQQRF